MHTVECAIQRGALLVGSKFQLVITKQRNSKLLLIINQSLMSTTLQPCAGPCIPCASCKPYPYTDDNHAQSCICTTDKQDTDNLATCVSNYCETSCQKSIFPSGNCQQLCENDAWPISSCNVDKIKLACNTMDQRTQSKLGNCVKNISNNGCSP